MISCVSVWISPVPRFAAHSPRIAASSGVMETWPWGRASGIVDNELSLLVSIILAFPPGGVAASKLSKVDRRSRIYARPRVRLLAWQSRFGRPVVGEPRLGQQNTLPAFPGKTRQNPVAVHGLRHPKPAGTSCSGNFRPGAGSRQEMPPTPARFRPAPTASSTPRRFSSWQPLYQNAAGGGQGDGSGRSLGAGSPFGSGLGGSSVGERSLRAGCVAVWISFNLRMLTWV